MYSLVNFLLSIKVEFSRAEQIIDTVCPPDKQATKAVPQWHINTSRLYRNINVTSLTIGIQHIISHFEFFSDLC